MKKLTLLITLLMALPLAAFDHTLTTPNLFIEHQYVFSDEEIVALVKAEIKRRDATACTEGLLLFERDSKGRTTFWAFEELLVVPQPKPGGTAYIVYDNPGSMRNYYTNCAVMRSHCITNWGGSIIIMNSSNTTFISR